MAEERGNDETLSTIRLTETTSVKLQQAYLNHLFEFMIIKYS